MAGLPEHCLLFRQTRVNPLKTCDSILTIIDESGDIPPGAGISRRPATIPVHASR
jgi:hypothetical protein